LGVGGRWGKFGFEGCFEYGDCFLLEMGMMVGLDDYDGREGKIYVRWGKKKKKKKSFVWF
jgi:hypothetical protein